ncbi:MAG: DUF3570 domain-containing protein [Gammaproteobacteria bacterium]|nr:DUF3570 domain-containing protein [Gammaproteobacteria bacterium]
MPEDRADLLYHSYDGGGAEIAGPSVLIRKKFSESFSASINNYVDNVTSASIDVITSGASKYKEKREENSISLDYLHEKTLMSAGFTESLENDFDAETFSMNISQDMFGDLTTVSLGYAQGDNIVGNSADPNFSEESNSRSFRISMTQVLTKDLIMALALETITDEGYLNNPYRSVRYLDGSGGYLFQSEVYPNTRTSNAFAVRARYYLPHRAAASAGYRFFSDTWGIDAHTIELSYTWPYSEDVVFDLSYRYYDQNKADFYSDLFPFANAQNFLARDKEMSTFTDHTIGFGVDYEFTKSTNGFIKRGSINFNYDLIMLDYDDFRDLTKSTPVPGQEPLYSFDASVIRLFLSIWF